MALLSIMNDLPSPRHVDLYYVIQIYTTNTVQSHYQNLHHWHCVVRIQEHRAIWIYPQQACWARNGLFLRMDFSLKAKFTKSCDRLAVNWPWPNQRPVCIMPSKHFWAHWEHVDELSVPVYCFTGTVDSLWTYHACWVIIHEGTITWYPGTKNGSMVTFSHYIHCLDLQ